MVKEQKGTIWSPKKFEKITRFTLSISSKNKQTNEWENGYLNCVIMNDKISRELEDKMKVEVDGNLSPNQYQGKDGKVHHEIQLWVSDLRFASGEKNNDIMQGFTETPADTDDSELPFV